MAASVQTPSVKQIRGIVKQVLSGDSIVIRGQPKGGPPPERQINFSSVIAPRLAKRQTQSQAGTPDEPYAWESREYLRKKIIGKEVLVVVETKTSGGREYGTVYLGKDISTAENLTETLISEGLLTVRRESIRGESNLVDLEDAAKSSGKGKWRGDDKHHIRDIKWNIENMREFVDRMDRKPIKAVVEHIRDGSTVRCFLVPDFYHITLMISGIRCPTFKLDSEGRPDKANAEPFAEQAKYFVESRLLQRDVEVILENVNNNNFVGTVMHPNGNIAHLLLRDGFAKCIKWALGSVTGGADKLKAAEKEAMDKQLRLWTDYCPTEQNLEKKEEFVGKVVEVVNGDAIVVKVPDGRLRKVFLSSIRPPRQEGEQQRQPGKSFRPLYDIPWMFEAREFLRKKLIGQKVKVFIDYVQPAQNNYPEKSCATIKLGDVNVAEAMVSKGFASVVRYRHNDDQRASCYDDLLGAEQKALKGNKGIHNKKEFPLHRVADLSGDSSKAKNFFPFLQRAGRTDAVVEFVASGSRLRLFIPKETCIITFLLAGISCPKATRPSPGGGSIQGDPYGAEALSYTKNLVLQKDVHIEVDSMDKGGNFIGWLYAENQNLSLQLVEHGLSSVHSTAETSAYYQQFLAAENMAKKKKINIWKNYIEVEKVEKIEECLTERKYEPRSVLISEVTHSGHLFGQLCSDKTHLEAMMDRLGSEFTARPPVGGSFTPRKGMICASKYVDGMWYRAKVERVSGSQVTVQYIDYGNREVTDTSKCAALPSSFDAPPYAHEYALALVKFHSDEENLEDAIQALMSEVVDKEVRVNREYSFNGMEHVSIQRPDNKTDVAKTLLSQGYVLLDSRKDKRLAPLVHEYRMAQDEAKKKHLNIWQYGDITEDDAFEFGMER